jgi:1-acyl-sn-glycerol-3-phosphate acyltransferase
MKNLSRWILKLKGWKLVVSVEEPLKSVICLAPHTSNWDFIIGKLSYWALDRKSHFLMKKSWFFFPLGSLFRAMGGIPIDRSKHTSVTQQMVDEFNRHDKFHLAITPEGTRKFVETWKMGFYYIALNAKIPIQLAYIDYKKKEMGITKIFIPTGDENADMEIIKSYYKGVSAKIQHNFSL